MKEEHTIAAIKVRGNSKDIQCDVNLGDNPKKQNEVYDVQYRQATQETQN